MWRFRSEALLNVLAQRNAGHSILHTLLPPSRSPAPAPDHPTDRPNNKSLYSESSSKADTFIDLLTHSVLTRERSLEQHRNLVKRHLQCSGRLRMRSFIHPRRHISLSLIHSLSLFGYQVRCLQLRLEMLVSESRALPGAHGQVAGEEHVHEVLELVGHLEAETLAHDDVPGRAEPKKAQQ